MISSKFMSRSCLTIIGLLFLSNITTMATTPLPNKQVRNTDATNEALLSEMALSLHLPRTYSYDNATEQILFLADISFTLRLGISIIYYPDIDHYKLKISFWNYGQEERLIDGETVISTSLIKKYETPITSEDYRDILSDLYVSDFHSKTSSRLLCLDGIFYAIESKDEHNKNSITGFNCDPDYIQRIKLADTLFALTAAKIPSLSEELKEINAALQNAE